MTSRQRLLRAIRCEEPDLVPIAPDLGEWPARHYEGRSLEAYLCCADDLGLDLLWTEECPIPNYVHAHAPEYDIPGVRVEQRCRESGAETILERTFETPAGALHDVTRLSAEQGTPAELARTEALVKEPGDLERLRYLLPAVRPRFDTLADFRRRIGERGLCQLSIDGCLDRRAVEARAMIDLMMDQEDAREFLRDHLALHHGHVMAITRSALAAGVEVIRTSWRYASPGVGWGLEAFRDLFLPLLEAHVALVHEHGAIYHYHDDGECMALLPMLASAGVDLLSTCAPSPAGDFDLACARAEVGDSICLLGHIDVLHTVRYGTRASMDRAIAGVLSVGGEGGGVILGTTGPIPADTPRVHVEAYAELARKHVGGYAAWLRGEKRGPR